MFLEKYNFYHIFTRLVKILLSWLTFMFHCLSVIKSKFKYMYVMLYSYLESNTQWWRLSKYISVFLRRGSHVFHLSCRHKGSHAGLWKFSLIAPLHIILSKTHSDSIRNKQHINSTNTLNTIENEKNSFQYSNSKNLNLRSFWWWNVPVLNTNIWKTKKVKMYF